MQNFAKQEKFVDNSDNQHMYIQWSSTSDLYEPGLWTIKNSTGYYLEYDIRNKQTKSYIRWLKSNKSFTVNLNDNEFISNMQALGRNNVPIDKNTEKMLKENCVVLKGDRLDIIDSIDYFEGIKSSGEVEGNKISILSSNKNLFNLNEIGKNFNYKEIENGFEISNTEDVPYPYANIKKYMFLKKGTYTFSYSGEGTGFVNVAIRSKVNSDSYSGDIKPNIPKTFTMDSDKEVVVTFYLQGNITTGTYKNKYTNIQLVEGSKSLNYEPYKEDKKDILLQGLGFDGGLRGLNDTVYDELNDIKNVAIKRIGKHIFTGNETIRQLENSTKALIVLVENIKGVDSKHFISNSNIGYEARWNVNEWENNYPIAFNFKDSSAGSMSLLISKSKIPSVTDIDSLKQYLRENNIELYYQLKEPIETPLNKDINFDTLDDITYVLLENNIKNELSCQCQVSLASSKA